VWSGSLAAVKVLVKAGATLDTRDTVQGGTPLGWAEHAKRAEIAAYLREKGAQA
jgi:ankyrin repeat protein